MNMRDVARMAHALRNVKPAFPPCGLRQRVAVETWALCIAALGDLFAKRVAGFDRTAFFRACGISVLAIYREH